MESVLTSKEIVMTGQAVLDEGIRKKNFDLFEAKYGVRLTIDADEAKKYSMGIAGNGEKVLYINGVLNGEDLRLNSAYNPTYEASRWMEKEEFVNRRTSVIMLGFSTGVFLWMLLNKMRPDTEFFVYEPDEGLFSFVCGYIDISAIIMDPRVHLYVTSKQKDFLSEDLTGDAVTFRPEILRKVTPFYSRDEVFDSACQEVERIAEATRNYRSERSRIALRCRLYSWNHMQKAYVIRDLQGRIPNDVPAVVVAAGPSLVKNVEVLRRIKNHAFIICTDRAASVLAERNIMPDALISVDALKSAKYLDDKLWENIPLFCSHQSNSDTQKMFMGRCVYYHGLIYDQEILGKDIIEVNGLDQGGNVAGGAFVVCQILGIKTVVLIGQDLGFLNGKHHADDNEEGVDPIAIKMVPGVDGGMVETNDMFLSFKDFFERQIAMNPDMRVIDATEGGAYINGSEVMSLSDVADMVSDKEFYLDNIFGELSYAQDKDGYEKCIEKQKEFMDDLDTIIDASEKIEVLCNQLLKISKYNNISDPKNNNKLKKLDDLRAVIYDKIIYLMMEEYWIEDTYSIPDITFMVRTNDEAVPVFENAVKFYHQLPDDCRSLKAEIEKAIEQGKRDGEL